jgi:hypothetical protein
MEQFMVTQTLPKRNGTPRGFWVFPNPGMRYAACVDEAENARSFLS